MIYLEIFLVFFRMGFISFGGILAVLPELENIIVNEKNWLTAKNFIDAYVIGQFVPGPNMSMSGVVGYWIAGIGGWIAALVGMYLGPLIIMKIASRFYEKHRDSRLLKKLEFSLRPLVFGLITASALKLFIDQTQGVILWALLMTTPLVWFYWKKKLSAIGAIFISGMVWWVFSKYIILT